MEYYEQGDVLLFPVGTLPKGCVTEDSNGVVQEGEATGHAHKFDSRFGEILTEPKSKERYLRIVKPVALKHEEHNPIDLPEGLYRIGIVKEYDHFQEEARQVQD